MGLARFNSGHALSEAELQHIAAREAQAVITPDFVRRFIRAGQPLSWRTSLRRVGKRALMTGLWYFLAMLLVTAALQSGSLASALVCLALALGSVVMGGDHARHVRERLELTRDTRRHQADITHPFFVHDLEQVPVLNALVGCQEQKGPLTNAQVKQAFFAFRDIERAVHQSVLAASRRAQFQAALRAA